MWEIVATEKETGRRVLLSTADNPTERKIIIDQETKRDVEKRYERIQAVRVWN